MIQTLIEAGILISLLGAFTDERLDLLTAGIISVVFSIGTTVLAFALIQAMGLFGLLLATVIAASLLGVAVSFLFGAEIKRSFLIGGLFLVAHITISVMFHSISV